MEKEGIFVGRKKELEQFGKVLEDPKGQAVIVVGQAGMGKTWLVNKMAEVAENHPGLKCGWVRYEVTPTDSVDSTMALMMDNAFDAAQVTERSFDGTKRRLEQWRSFLNVFNLGDLAINLRRDPAKNTREQFLGRLRLISKRMPGNGRAVFIIDPEKYMQKDSDQSWAIVVKELPEKIKFVFAQRPGDVLVDSETVGALNNVVSIPEKRLGVLEEESVDELLTQSIKGAKYTVTEIREVLSRYEGHPYALGAALDLIEGGIELEELPEKAEPTQFAEVQWNKVSNKSGDAIGLFKAYAILEVGIPDDVVEAVSEIDSNKRQHLVADKYLRGLLREEGEGRRIYHAILADYIVWQISEVEKKEIHGRAVGVYREKLEQAEEAQTKPDALSAMRLAEHVLVCKGPEKFAITVVNYCFNSLFDLGFIDDALNLLYRSLKFALPDSYEQATVYGDLSRVYMMRGELNEAEAMLWKAVQLFEKIQNTHGIATAYANIAEIYKTRGDMTGAERLFLKAFELFKSISDFRGMASQCVHLGFIYQKLGALHKAERMYRKSLEINEKIHNLDGIATGYRSLSMIHQAHGEWEQAEEKILKAAKIHEQLGYTQNIAADYDTLATFYGQRGELKRAEEMTLKALEIHKQLDHIKGAAGSYGNLGLVYSLRGEFEEAEKAHRVSLKLHNQLGDLEGKARNYTNLGLNYHRSGDLENAEKMFLDSLRIHEQLGHWEGRAIVYSNLAGIHLDRGDYEECRKYAIKSRDIYQKIGMLHMVEHVEGLIKELKD